MFGPPTGVALTMSGLQGYPDRRSGGWGVNNLVDGLPPWGRRITEKEIEDAESFCDKAKRRYGVFQNRKIWDRFDDDIVVNNGKIHNLVLAYTSAIQLTDNARDVFSESRKPLINRAL